MWNIRFLLIATAFTLSYSLPTSLNTDQEFLIPYNDLLPPLSEDDISNATTTTTNAPTISAIKTTKKTLATHVPPPLFKSTKKSYYQQQTEHIKELHLIDDEKLVPHDYREQAEHLQHLHEEQNNEYRQQQQKLLLNQRLQQLQDFKTLKPQSNSQEAKIATTTKTATLRPVARHVVTGQQKIKSIPQKAAKPFIKQAKQKSKTISTAQKSTVKVHEPLLVAQEEKQIILTHDDLKLENFTPALLKSETSQKPFLVPTMQQTHQPHHQNPQRFAALKQQSNAFNNQHSSEHRFNLQQRYQVEALPLDLNALHQYIDYQHTTHRPLKAGLPTLTPFPRHLK